MNYELGMPDLVAQEGKKDNHWVDKWQSSHFSSVQPAPQKFHRMRLHANVGASYCQIKQCFLTPIFYR